MTWRRWLLASVLVAGACSGDDGDRAWCDQYLVLQDAFLAYEAEPEGSAEADEAKERADEESERLADIDTPEEIEESVEYLARGRPPVPGPGDEETRRAALEDLRDFLVDTCGVPADEADELIREG